MFWILALLAMIGCSEAPTATDDVAPGTSSPRAGPVDLDAHARKVFSSQGEDGIVEKIFEIIQPTHRYVVEFGAHDGVTNSNARNLIVNHGWGGYLIEGNPARARELAKAYESHPSVKTEQAWIYPGNIEILFEDAGVPEDFDYLVIDIDSNDYYVWRAIQQYRPKVVNIETNMFWGPEKLMVIDFHPMNYWDGSHYHGASLQSMVNLAKQKGYELVHCMKIGPNTFFVDAQYYPLFGIEDNSPEKMFKMWSAAKKGPQPFPEGKETLKIDAFEIPKRYLHDR